MRVAAAEFHQVIPSVASHLAGDRCRELPRNGAVAEFVDVFHGAASVAVAARAPLR